MDGRRLLRFVFYKPYWGHLLTDVILLIVSFFVVLAWFPLNTSIPFQKYYVFALVFSAIWLLVSYFGHRYLKIKYLKVGNNLLRLLVVAIVVFALMWVYMYLISESEKYSIYVLLTIWLAMFLMSVLFTLITHAYRYALNAEPEIARDTNRKEQKVLHKAVLFDAEEKQQCYDNVVALTSNRVLQYLLEHIELASSNTFTLNTSEIYNIAKLRYYAYDTIVNFMPLNQIRGINKMFGMVNDKLPDDGMFVCCFQPQEVIKRQILRRYPPILNYIIYSFFFLYKRVVPKIFMTSRLYFDITEGKDRVLSKAEVLGRLCYCGFEIVDEHKIDNTIYVVARRSFTPVTVQRRMYGMFIKLNRVGKNGKEFKVYKFRTMHPYSEYLQEYVYKRYSLQEGGKFNHDIRVTTLGRFARKCWIDELPMLLNVVKGDMKLVGVRPLSKQYFSLYSPELQKKRTQHKPGLLPPFYADMPKTLDEIQASEMKYLIQCEQKGTFRTDFVYFWKILYSILFKRARSN